MKKKHCTAILLAGGSGSRMGTKVKKQYLDISGYPMLYYSLRAFEDSRIIDDVILVVGQGQIAYVQEELIEKYHFGKVRTIVEGGKERYDSVWSGLQVLSDADDYDDARPGFVFIHDGARPFVDEAILKRAYEGVSEYRACVIGMPSKDTVKLVDKDACARETPNRNYVWVIQTPQVFEAGLIIDAYAALMKQENICVTDDAMVVEQQMHLPVKMIEGSYENIKVTTPEDLDIAEVFVKRIKANKKP